MRTAPGDSAAWAALLPGDTVWLTGHSQRGTRQFRSEMTASPQARCRAVVAAPWASTRAKRSGDHVERNVVQAYVAFPSCEEPILVASRDTGVLRYVADSVLSVPPGTGRLPSMVLTAGLRLLRLPAMWSVAAFLRAASVVLVGRAE